MITTPFHHAAFLAAATVVATLLPVQASSGQTAGQARVDPPAATSDSAFRALQARGKSVMGVDQYTSAHKFEMLADGGRIVLERQENDSAGIATIRAHMRAVAEAFKRGDFSMSAQVHAMEVPGTRVLAGRRQHIEYTVEDLPRGAQVRITTKDEAALAALRQFFAFQNSDHRTGHSHD